MNGKKLRSALSLLLLGTGYITATLQWLWVFIVGVPPLIQNGSLDWLVVAQETPVLRNNTEELSPFAWVFIGVVTVAMIVLTVIILIRLPRTIAKTGQSIVQHTTDLVVPIIVHKKHVPLKKRRIISQRTILVIQLIGVVTPMLIALLLPAAEELTRTIIVIVALTLLLASSVSFVAAWLLRPSVATSRTRSHASRG